MAKKMKGVTSITRNGTEYWYTRVDGRRVYCGIGAKGRELAVAARAKYVARQYENREMAAGLRVKKVEFKTVRDMVNWYMELPKVQKQKSYYRKINACTHLLDYFGNNPVHGIESDDIERYREARDAAANTINVEIALLSAVYHEAKRAKKIHADMFPGEFPIVQEINPRPPITEKQYEKLLEAVSSDFADVLI